MHSQHGGQLRHAVKHYNIPLENWIDLSTGINPNGYPIPDIPAVCWQRLPEDNDDLLASAKAYYQSDSLLAIAGSQAAIQALPSLYSCAHIGVLSTSYYEHEACWKQAGHKIIRLTPETINQALNTLNILIIVNPNNPTGQLFPKQQLLDWHQELQAQQGMLIVDEAFMDTTPENSLSPLSPQKGLIILRSVGKFFGLAGARCGFIFAEKKLLKQLEVLLGRWPLAHPSRYLVTIALKDKHWQQQTQITLRRQSKQLHELLETQGWHIEGNHALFQWIQTPHAEEIHHALAQKGIFTRLFKSPESLRFGLPKNNAECLQLKQALSQIYPV